MTGAKEIWEGFSDVASAHGHRFHRRGPWSAVTERSGGTALDEPETPVSVVHGDPSTAAEFTAILHSSIRSSNSPADSTQRCP